MKQHYRFALVGALGFIVDGASFALLLQQLHDPYLARIGAFVVAVALTFILNYHFTFPQRKRRRPLSYLTTQGIGLGINMLVFTLVIWHPLWLPWQYYLGLVAGSLTAMVFNYEMSRRHVFA